jgi:cobalt-zinc-cadmium efflux system membrane fusion protein
MKLKIGQPVLITLANEAAPRAATIYLIGKEISEERTVRVHCHLAKEDPSLIPGMYFSAVIETGETQVYAVPENAIASFEGKSYLFIASEKNTFSIKEVQTGATESGFVEVILPNGFDVASTIVTNGTYALISKFKNSEED